jgi:hypothetical protein
MPMNFGQNFIFQVPPKVNLTSSKSWVGYPDAKACMLGKLDLNGTD